MTDLINLNNEQKFTSLYLVEQINIFRKEEGGNDLLHSDFLKKVEREFDEEIGEGKISPTSYTDKSNRQSKCYELTFEQSLQILMSESKTVRKRVVEVLKKQQETIKNMTPVFKVPQTFKEALLLAVEQQETIEKQEQLLLEQKPKVEFADQLLLSANGIDFGTSAKAMNLPFGRNKLFKICREHGWLFGQNQPKQSLVDSGYFVVLETSYVNPKTLDRVATTKTLITVKGQKWLVSKLRGLGYME